VNRTWPIPLVLAALVFAFVLFTTPPGFRAIVDVLVSSPRGVNADAAAYALGAASSLAFMVLLGLAVIMSIVEIAMRRLR
jgi:hypothetical protein